MPSLVGSEMCIRDRRIRCHPRIRHPSIHLQLQQTEDENGGPSHRYRHAKCRNPNPTGLLLNPNLGFVDAAPPAVDDISSPDQESSHKSTTPTTRGRNDAPPGRYCPARCGNPNLGLVDPRPPSGRIWSHPRITNPSIHLQPQQGGAKTVIPPVNNAPHDEETPIRRASDS